jgi:cellulose synthase/poly-beta-1,6-N-acetylglucosamine synthase-like glycosyltransferase
MQLFSDFVVFFLLFITMYFEIFLLVTYFEEKGSFHPDAGRAKRSRMPGKYPTVTIIVPAWNEGETLTGTVLSLLALDYPKDRLTIFIVDDGSTDDTLAVARKFDGNSQVRIFSKENGGKYTALNLGIAECKTDLIGCLDADSFVDKNALREIVPYFDNPEVMAVTPSVQIHMPDNILRKIQATEYMIGQFTRKLFSRLNGLYVTPGPFSIYRHRIFEEIGNFKHAYNTEDMEMALRLQANRMKIENSHTSFVYTVSPKTPRALYKQRVRWVSGFLKNAFFEYRFMFLSRKYGNLGFLVMPFAFISIFVALFFTVLYMKNIMHFLYERYLQYATLGFHPHLGTWKFDWFSLDLEFRALIIYMLFFTTFFFIVMGVRLAKKRLSFDIVYFLLLYGFIAPFWLARSLYNLVTAKEAKWR